MLPIIEIPNENYWEEKRQQREKNSGENVPHQYVPKMRHYKEIIYEATLTPSSTGRYNIYEGFDKLNEINIREFEYAGSLMDALQSRYLSFKWQLCRNPLEADPASRTVYDNNKIGSEVKINNAKRITKGKNAAYEEIVVRIINVMEINE